MQLILACAAFLLWTSQAEAATHECRHKLSSDGTEIWQCGHEDAVAVTPAEHKTTEPPPHEPPPHSGSKPHCAELKSHSSDQHDGRRGHRHGG